MALNSLNANQPSHESEPASPAPQSKIQTPGTHAVGDGHPKSKIPRPVHPRPGIPELGGVCRYEEVGAPGFGV